MPSAPTAAPFRRLVVGDKVAALSPSSPPPSERGNAGLVVLRGWGLEPVVMSGATATHPVLSSRGWHPDRRLLDG